MPVGIIINCLSVALGGICGTLAGRKLSEDFKTQLNMVLVMPFSWLWSFVILPLIS